jgi:hypothetical protein
MHQGHWTAAQYLRRLHEHTPGVTRRLVTQQHTCYTNLSETRLITKQAEPAAVKQALAAKSLTCGADAAHCTPATMLAACQFLTVWNAAALEGR